jgi:hypothetical protein
VRKTLGQHEIATVQTTAINRTDRPIRCDPFAALRLVHAGRDSISRNIRFHGFSHNYDVKTLHIPLGWTIERLMIKDFMARFPQQACASVLVRLTMPAVWSRWRGRSGCAGSLWWSSLASAAS